MPGYESKLILFLLILIGNFAFFAAQAETVKSEASANSVMIEPVGLAFGIWGASLERELLPQVRLGFGFNYLKSQDTDTSTEELEYKLSVSYFFRPHEYNSFWVQAQGGIDRNLTIRNRDNRRTDESNPVYFLTAGYSVDFATNWNTRLGAGLSIAPTTATNQVQPMLQWQMGLYF